MGSRLGATAWRQPWATSWTHATDLLGYAGFALVSWLYVRRGASPLPLLATLALGALATYHLSCQQLADAGRNSPIQGLPRVCGHASELRWTRWVGVGSCNLAILYAIHYYCAAAR